METMFAGSVYIFNFVLVATFNLLNVVMLQLSISKLAWSEVYFFKVASLVLYTMCGNIHGHKSDVQYGSMPLLCIWQH